MAKWQIQIMKLFNDFCLPTEKGKEIVKRVQRQYSEKTDDYKYERAWCLFKEELLAH